MVWYSHLFKNFSQFVVILTIKGFDVVIKANELEDLNFSDDVVVEKEEKQKPKKLKNLNNK